MMLAIQPEEAIDSFYSRNLCFFQSAASTKINRFIGIDVHYSGWSLEALIALSKAMEWHDESGISRLLFNHTNIRSGILVENDLKYLYVGNIKPFIRMVSRRTDIVKACVSCAREDYKRLGFVYWRRAHQHSLIDVCTVHNEILEIGCPSCGRPFLIKSNYYGGFWEACECGSLFANGSPRLSNDAWILKLSKFASDINNGQKQYLTAGVKCLITYRLLDWGLSGSLDKDVDSVVDFFGGELPESINYLFRSGLRALLSQKKDMGLKWDEVIIILCALFGDFEKFVSAAEDFKIPCRTTLDIPH